MYVCMFGIRDDDGDEECKVQLVHFFLLFIFTTTPPKNSYYLNSQLVNCNSNKEKQ